MWNVSPHPVTIDMNTRATLPCDWRKVDAALAEQLVQGPDWQFENPRKRPERVKDVK